MNIVILPSNAKFIYRIKLEMLYSLSFSKHWILCHFYKIILTIQASQKPIEHGRTPQEANFEEQHWQLVPRDEYLLKQKGHMGDTDIDGRIKWILNRM
jgi:hypothetical protein